MSETLPTINKLLGWMIITLNQNLPGIQIIQQAKTNPFIISDTWTHAAVASFFHVHLPVSDLAFFYKVTVQGRRWALTLRVDGEVLSTTKIRDNGAERCTTHTWSSPLCPAVSKRLRFQTQSVICLKTTVPRLLNGGPQNFTCDNITQIFFPLLNCTYF